VIFIFDNSLIAGCYTNRRTMLLKALGSKKEKEESVTCYHSSSIFHMQLLFPPCSCLFVRQKRFAPGPVLVLFLSKGARHSAGGHQVQIMQKGVGGVFRCFMFRSVYV
jgi:hypothetical protein